KYIQALQKEERYQALHKATSDNDVSGLDIRVSTGSVRTSFRGWTAVPRVGGSFVMSAFKNTWRPDGAWVYCRWNGCTKTIQRALLRPHEDSCDHREVSCECGHKTTNLDLEKHRDTDCTTHRIKCPVGCGMTIRRLSKKNITPDDKRWIQKWQRVKDKFQISDSAIHEIRMLAQERVPPLYIIQEERKEQNQMIPIITEQEHQMREELMQWERKIQGLVQQEHQMREELVQKEREVEMLREQLLEQDQRIQELGARPRKRARVGDAPDVEELRPAVQMNPRPRATRHRATRP
ncbi:Hypp9365, partial [Branchiostoma lanceolatum]